MKAIKLFLSILPHLLLIVACMFVTFLIIDTQNKAMEFVESDLSKGVMAVWCVLSVATSVTLIAAQRRSERERAKRQTSATQPTEQQPAGSDDRLEEALERALAELRARKK